VTALRWLAFGDLDAGVWGLAWMPGENGAGSVALGAGADTMVVRGELQGGGPSEDWLLRGEALELAVSAEGEDVSVDDSSRSLKGVEVKGFDQLARVKGSLTLQGAEHPVDSLAWRAVLRGLPEPNELASQRLIAAWFEPAAGLAALALRPRKARGQEGDLVSAALFESGQPVPVSDPRLSTTYTGDGVPVRAGVELWVSETVEPEQDAQEHPHRAAGEATGARTTWTEGALGLSAQPFRWHAHGRDGAGVYVLGQSA
jgi:hypothetical protein